MKGSKVLVCGLFVSPVLSLPTFKDQCADIKTKKKEECNKRDAAKSALLEAQQKRDDAADDLFEQQSATRSAERELDAAKYAARKCEERHDNAVYYRSFYPREQERFESQKTCCEEQYDGDGYEETENELAWQKEEGLHNAKTDIEKTTAFERGDGVSKVVGDKLTTLKNDYTDCLAEGSNSVRSIIAALEAQWKQCQQHVNDEVSSLKNTVEGKTTEKCSGPSGSDAYCKAKSARADQMEDDAKVTYDKARNKNANAAGNNYGAARGATYSSVHALYDYLKDAILKMLDLTDSERRKYGYELTEAEAQKLKAKILADDAKAEAEAAEAAVAEAVAEDR